MPRPPPSRQSFRSMTSSSPPPRPAPFRRGSGHQTRAPRSENGQQRDALRERAVAAAQHQPCQRLGCRARRRWKRSRRRRLRCEAGGEGGNGIGSGGWDGGGAGGGAAAASVDDRGGAGEGGTGRRHGAGSVVVGRKERRVVRAATVGEAVVSALAAVRRQARARWQA